MDIEHMEWLALPRLQVAGESLYKEIQDEKAQRTGCPRKQLEGVRKKVTLKQREPWDD